MDAQRCPKDLIRYDVLDGAGWITVRSCCAAHAVEAARAARAASSQSRGAPELR